MHFLGQERDPPIPPKPKQELEDILDIDHDYSSTERKKSCKYTHKYQNGWFLISLAVHSESS